MQWLAAEPPRKTVALRKESVDRNILADFLFRQLVRRSPQGERG